MAEIGKRGSQTIINHYPVTPTGADGTRPDGGGEGWMAANGEKKRDGGG
jgi:hypothetical protein